jgi:DNA-binding IclR family transcriptional regulator
LRVDEEVSMSGIRREPGRTVTSKVFGILNAFTPADRELALHDIAERSGLPPSTALRLARELVALGALERTPVGRYRIGLGLWQTGSLAVEVRDLRESAALAMRDLCRTIQAGVQLAIHEGTQTVVVDMLAAPGSREIWPFMAAALPLHATAAGKLLLATLPPQTRVRLLRGQLRRYTPRTIVMPGLLLSGLEAVAMDGIATNIEETLQGWSAVAAYIRVPAGGIGASVAAAVRSGDFDRERLAARVRGVAQAVEQRLPTLTRNWY